MHLSSYLKLLLNCQIYFDFRQECKLKTSQSSSNEACAYWMLNGNVKEKRQASLESKVYYELESSFRIDESNCKALSYVCLVSSPKAFLNLTFDLDPSLCIRAVDGYETSYGSATSDFEKCWNYRNHFACVKKHWKPLLPDNAVIRFCWPNIGLKPLDIDWKPQSSLQLFAEKETKIFVDFTIVNIRESSVFSDGFNTFSIRIFLADETLTDDVTDFVVSSDPVVIEVDKSWFKDESDVGVLVRFRSVSVSVPSFSTSSCNIITRLGLATYELGNSDPSFISWVILNKNEKQCGCDVMDFSLSRFYTNQYFFQYPSTSVIPFHAVIRYSLKGNKQNYLDSHGLLDIFQVKLLSSSDRDFRPRYTIGASSIDIKAIKYFDEAFTQDADDSNCDVKTGFLYIQGKVNLGSQNALRVYGKYLLQATFNKDASANEIDFTNNVLDCEIVFLRSQDDFLQLVSASSVFTLEDNDIFAVETVLSVQYSGLNPFPLYAGADFLKVNALFGNVNLANAFAVFDSAQVLKLKEATECGMQRKRISRSTHIRSGEVIELRKRFYAVSSQVAELYCSGYTNFVITAESSSLYGLQESFFDNNAIEKHVPENLIRCQDLLPVARRRIRSFFVVPVTLSVDVPEENAYLVANSVYQNNFVVSLSARLSNYPVDPDLFQLYQKNLVGTNALTVFANLSIRQHGCFEKPCPETNLTRLRFVFDAQQLLQSKSGLDEIITFQLPVQEKSVTCGWSELSWNFELESTDQKVITFEQFNTACPIHPSKVFVMCGSSSLAVTSFSQNFPPFSHAPTESFVFASVTGKVRIHFFEISAIATGTRNLSNAAAYEISLCELSLCNEKTNDGSIKISLLDHTVIANKYPSIIAKFSETPGNSELVEIEGRIKIDYSNNVNSIPNFLSVPVFIRKLSSGWKFFGNLIINPFRLYEAGTSERNGFSVESFSFFNGSTINKKLSGTA